MGNQGVSRRDFFRTAAVAGAAVAVGTAAGSAGAAEAVAVSGSGSATVQGFGGPVTVELTVTDGVITDISITGEGETPDRGGRAIDVMGNAYLEAGTLEVDGIAGATVTSTAVKDCATRAYAQATGQASDTAVHMKPGEYTGSAVGYWGIWELPVTITVNETSLLAIEAPEARAENGETEGFFAAVRDKLFPRIVKYQSTAVDAVTGATASSAAAKAAIDAALLEALAAGGSDSAALEAFHTTPAKEEEGVVEEIDADMVVVGLSQAGLIAMKGALESLLKDSERAKSIKIIGLDKCAKLGGQSFMTHSPNIVNPVKHMERAADPAKFQCDTEALRADWLAHCVDNRGVQRAKEEMVDLFIAETGNALDWLTYEQGLMIGEPKGVTDFSSTDFAAQTCWYYVCNSGGDKFYESNEDRRAVMLAWYRKILEETKCAGGSWYTETEAYEFLFDAASNSVTGVKARDLFTGKEYVIHTNCVFMSTGGFGQNKELMNTLLPRNLAGEWKQNGCTTNDGKLFQAALNIGAATYNADLSPITMEIGMPRYLQHFPINFKEGAITKRTGRQSTWTLNDIPLYMCVSINSLAVGPDGNRVCNEYGIGNGMEDRVPPDTWVAGPYFYSIWSQDQVDVLASEGFTSENIKRTVAYCQQGGFNLDEPRPEMQEALDACIDEDLAWKGETLEELAAAIGVPAEALTATVERYNGFCAVGVDEDFGKEPQWLTPIGSGPYYAVKAMNVMYGSGGGLDVDANMNVLSSDGTPIGGLYAGGQDSFGVIENPDKNYIGYGGVCQGWQVLSGYIGGREAARYLYDTFGLLSEREA